MSIWDKNQALLKFYRAVHPDIIEWGRKIREFYGDVGEAKSMPLDDVLGNSFFYVKGKLVRKPVAHECAACKSPFVVDGSFFCERHQPSSSES